MKWANAATHSCPQGSCTTVGDTVPLARTVPGRDNNLMSETGMVRQCPYCELRFTYHNEVKDHICHDHREHAEVVLLIEPHELPHG